MAFGTYSKEEEEHRNGCGEAVRLWKCPHHVVKMVEQFLREVVVVSDVLTRAECVLMCMHMHTYM